MPRSAQYVLDTNILVSYVRAGPLGRWIELNYQISARPGRSVISVVTQAEVLALARKLSWGPDRRSRLNDMLARLHILDISFPEIIDAYVEIDYYGSSRREAVNMQKNDLWIAATAHVLSLPLLTTDRDFDHLHPDWIQREWVG